MHEEIGFLASILTIALTPVILFYAWAALHSEYAHNSRREWGSFWHILLAVILLGVSELAEVYANVAVSPHILLIAAVGRLAVFILLLAHIRSKVKESVDKHLSARAG